MGEVLLLNYDSECALAGEQSWVILRWVTPPVRPPRRWSPIHLRWNVCESTFSLLVIDCETHSTDHSEVEVREISLIVLLLYNRVGAHAYAYSVTVVWNCATCHIHMSHTYVTSVDMSQPRIHVTTDKWCHIHTHADQCITTCYHFVSYILLCPKYW